MSTRTGSDSPGSHQVTVSFTLPSTREPLTGNGRGRICDQHRGVGFIRFQIYHLASQWSMNCAFLPPNSMMSFLSSQLDFHGCFPSSLRWLNWALTPCCSTGSPVALGWRSTGRRSSLNPRLVLLGVGWQGVPRHRLCGGWQVASIKEGREKRRGATPRMH